MKPVRAWRAYYSPDLWHCGRSAEGATDLPDGILVLVAYETKNHSPNKPYRRILAGSDWYFWAAGYVGSLTDFKRPSTAQKRNYWLSPDPILKRFPNAVLKKGVWAPDEEYGATRKAALEAESSPW